VRQKTDAAGHHYEVAVWSWPGYAFIGNRHDKDTPRGRIFYFYDPLTDQSAKAQGLTPKPQPGKAGTYTVQKGDSLSRLAKQFGVSSDDLAKANPGLTEKSLKAGATINVPGKAVSQPAGDADKTATSTPDRTPTPLAKPAPMAAPTASGGFIEYKVKEGDILSKWPMPTAPARAMSSRPTPASIPMPCARARYCGYRPARPPRHPRPLPSRHPPCPPNRNRPPRRHRPRRRRPLRDRHA
jgi:LysM repeat protein